jgi:hypothetical protein
MPDLQTILQGNRKERERLLALVAGLKESDFQRRLPNGWTIGVTLVHLAFWDLRQAAMLKRWLEQGVKPAPIASMDPDVVNGPLATLSETIPSQAVVKLVTDAAQAIDELVKKLTPAQAEELSQSGLERNIHRAQHRRHHLDKIEKTLSQ